MRAACVLLALAVALRVAHQVAIARNDPLASVPTGDELTFFRLAHSGLNEAPYQAPLFPWLLSWLFAVVDGPVGLGVAHVLQSCMSLGAAVLAASVARRWGRTTALVAFALAAFARPLLHADGTLLRESGSALALVSVFIFLQRARAGSSHLGLGVALGVGVLLRENFAIVALVVGIERLVALLSARRIRELVLLVVAGLAPVLPFDAWVAHLGAGVHPLPHWNSGCVFYLANRRDNHSLASYEPPPFLVRGSADDEVTGFRAEAERRTGRAMQPHEVGSFWLREGLGEIASDPSLFARRVYARAVSSILPWELAHQRAPDVDAEASWVLRAPLLDAGVLVVLGLAGVLAAARTREGRALLLVLGAWWLSFLFAAFTTRYRVPAIPLLAVLGALGGREVARSLRGSKLLAIAFVVVVAFVFGLRRWQTRDVANGLRTRALARMERGEWALASTDFERAIAAGLPVDATTLVFLGEASFRANDFPRARSAFLEATTIAPRRADAWRWLGVTEALFRRPRAAIAAFERAAGLGDSDAPRLIATARSRLRDDVPDASPPSFSR